MENEILTSDLILKGHRTLATVVFTDCVGFSARMSVNEEHTLDLIRRDLKLMKGICEQFEGRVLKTTGDGLLLCFSSAVKAVQCAIAIQHKIAEDAALLPPNDALIHRIGIHLADMYITETDVMGNGVNIAARLQTEADPGGICISQTVYDVAKHGLQLDAEYLGPRELKNIREVVPAYKILLDTDSAQVDPYAEATRHLEQSPNFSRIRKLIFYVCKKRWESDDYQLSNLKFRGLLQEFLSLSATSAQLRSLLNEAVSTLSKQAEYAIVSNEILAVVSKLYLSDPLTHPPLDSAATDSASVQARGQTVANAQQQQVYGEIAQQIDQHTDGGRIKKLLYYICKRQWQGDVQSLNQAVTRGLVQELHLQAPSLEHLQPLVEKFVQTLNKQAEYSLVANILVGKLQALYVGTPTQALQSAEATGELLTAANFAPPLPAALPPTEPPPIYQAIATELEHDPQQLRFKKLIFYVCHNQWISEVAQLATLSMAALLLELHTLAPSRDRLHFVFQTAINTLSKKAEYSTLATLLMQKLDRLYQPLSAAPTVATVNRPAPAFSSVAPSSRSSPAPSERSPDSPTVPPKTGTPKTGTPPPPPPPSNEPAAANATDIHLFDVRLGILKYTNPLKAKILAFSALHSDFHFSRQDWLNLKGNELDELLRSLLVTCKNYTDLEHLLYSTARRLTQPGELVQTAETVAKCLRTFYVHGTPTPLVKASGEETKISLDEFEESTQEIMTLNDDDEHTRQLAPALPRPNPGTDLQADSPNQTQLLQPPNRELNPGG